MIIFSKIVILNSGYEMPIYGIGTYSLLDEDVYLLFR